MSTPNASYNEYLEQRSSNDLDMIATIRALLVESGASADALSAYDNNHLILEAASKVPSVQRFLLNRFWAMQLMSCPIVSVKERYCLIPNGEIEDWIRLFKMTILPFVLKNNLPHHIQ